MMSDKELTCALDKFTDDELQSAIRIIDAIDDMPGFVIDCMELYELSIQEEICRRRKWHWSDDEFQEWRRG